MNCYRDIILKNHFYLDCSLYLVYRIRTFLLHEKQPNMSNVADPFLQVNSIMNIVVPTTISSNTGKTALSFLDTPRHEGARTVIKNKNIEVVTPSQPAMKKKARTSDDAFVWGPDPYEENGWWKCEILTSRWRAGSLWYRVKWLDYDGPLSKEEWKKKEDVDHHLIEVYHKEFPLPSSLPHRSTFLSSPLITYPTRPPPPL